MKFWDTGVFYGTVKISMPGVDYSLESLLRRMEEYNIERALVYHAMAKEHDAPTGNERLMDEIRGHDNLLPVWALLPHHTGEMEAPEALVRTMLSRGVKAATMFPAPGYHNFSMKRWSVGPLMKALAGHRIPLILGMDQLGGMEGLGEFAMEYPENPIIATNLNYRVDRILYALIDKMPNLYLETSAYKPFFGLQEFVKHFGAERLVFGSGMPAIDPAASAAIVTWSGLPADQQELIAHGNIERLIAEVE